ncbi:MAG: phosphoethanolamine transferase [Bacteroidaceae bacterium]|nr:phosphoethanolamine transferase [Bacteroidaceae bacterium]
MCSKTAKRLLRWLLLPPQECTLLFVIGIAAWLLLRALTKWTVDSNWVYMPHLLVDLYVLGLLVCLLPKKGRSIALVAIYIIMYMSGFAESFIYQRYYMHFTPQTLTMIEETTPTESSGFLRLCWESPIMWKTLMWWGMLLTLHILLLVGRWFACRMWPKLKTRTMPWVVRGFTTLIVISLFWWIPARCEVIKFLMLERTEQAERIDNGIFYSTPWRVVYALKFDQLSQRELLTLAQNMQKISGVESDSGVPLIVLVIGESHNKHHSSVYGYSLPTTPWQSRMTQEGTGIIMQDAVTPWNVTSSVFKEMFSTHSCDQPGLWTDGVLFPALMRKAGYRVGFISNQFYKTNRQTSANYNGSFFLNSQPFDSLCFDYRNTKHYVYDIGMLKEWTPMISSREFIILHLLGQHQPYDERLTKKGHVFSAKDIKRKDLTLQERQTVADYDNATLENDRLLQRVWERIGDNDAVMIYLSDHGEEIYDGNIGMFGRNHMAEPTPEIMWAEFEVPLEIFVSKKAQKNHPWLMAALQEARIKPFAIDDIPHLIMRLGDVRCNNYNAERDPLSTTFKPRLRPVKGGITTYEKLMNRL